MPQILDIFHYLQARSSTYPYIDGTILMFELFIPMGLNKANEWVVRQGLKNIMIECVSQARMNEKYVIEREGGKYLYNRAMFEELLMRLASHVFSN